MIIFNSDELRFSIVNTANYSRETAKDVASPFTFFDFIKYLQEEYSPELYSPLYSNYLKLWHSQQDITVSEQKEQYKQFYKEFMEQIILNYTTQTEKEFLKKADFNSATDLDIVIPFYANRLTEIATFYKNKREDGKYIINENKVKGSRYGLERAIFDSIYNYIVNTDDFLTTGTNLSSVINDFGISIAEYVDVYGDYFDLPRENITTSSSINTTAQGISSLRDDLYDLNIFDINNNYYTDPEAVEVLRESSFLASIDDFKINPPAFNEADITSLCNPEENLLDELDEVFTVGGLSLAEVYDIKRQLISKYTSCDFYYLNTSPLFGTVSGLLFEADQPTNNLLNLQSADIATLQSGQQQLLRETGIFFKPDDIGLFKLNSGKAKFVVDTDNLIQNKVYIFPDPNIYGNVGVNTLSAYPFLYTFDFSENIRNTSSSIATGDPKITNKSLTFEPYSTKQRETQELTNLNTMSYKLNFSDLCNQGAIRKMAYDLFGNEYALLKPESLQTRETLAKDVILNLQLNGYAFYDDIFDEGYSFDYNATGCSNAYKRSGMTVNLGGFIQEEEPWYINLRNFTPYQELQGVPVCGISDLENSSNANTPSTAQDPATVAFWRDGGSFTKQDGTPLPDPLKTTDVQYPGNFTYYYDILVDGLEGFVDVREIAGWTDYDGGRFTDTNLTDRPFTYESTGYRYIDTSNSNSRTVLSDLNTRSSGDINVDRLLISGNLYVKNQGTALSQPIVSALSETILKYNRNIVKDIQTNLLDFDVINDSIFLETPNRLIIDKIKYSSEGKFVKPSTSNTVFEVDRNDTLNVISNRLYVKTKKTCNTTGAVYFAVFKTIKKDLNTGMPLPKNYWYVYPEIYQYDLASNSYTSVFPEALNDSCLDTFKTSFPGLVSDYAPEKIKTVKLGYNSLYNKLKLTYIMLDQNNFTHIHDCLFEWRDGVLSLAKVVRFIPDELTLRTTTFNRETSFAEVTVSSGALYLVEQDTQNNLLRI